MIFIDVLLKLTKRVQLQAFLKKILGQFQVQGVTNNQRNIQIWILVKEVLEHFVTRMSH